MRRRLTLTVVAAVTAFLPMACAYEGLTMSATRAVILQGQGALAAPAPGLTADTYNPALAPVGARLNASMNPSGTSTTAVLEVSGMLPNRSYAVLAHTHGCGADPAAAGPAYQNRVDPAATAQAPSTNPEFANPQNEVWMEVRTDANGAGTARTTVPFVFNDRGPGSLMVHQAMEIATGPGHAGDAGAPVACLTMSAVGNQGATLK
ncbi:MAG: superoxide dismutase [Pseudonocardiaceae bacterium]